MCAYRVVNGPVRVAKQNRSQEEREHGLMFVGLLELGRNLVRRGATSALVHRADVLLERPLVREKAPAPTADPFALLPMLVHLMTELVVPPRELLGARREGAGEARSFPGVRLEVPRQRARVLELALAAGVRAREQARLELLQGRHHRVQLRVKPGGESACGDHGRGYAGMIRQHQTVGEDAHALTASSPRWVYAVEVRGRRRAEIGRAGRRGRSQARCRGDGGRVFKVL